MRCHVKAAVSVSISTGIFQFVARSSVFSLQEPTSAFSPSSFEALGQVEKGLLKIESCCRVY